MLFNRFITLLLEPTEPRTESSVRSQQINLGPVISIPPTLEGIVQGLAGCDAQPDDVVVLIRTGCWLYNDLVYYHLHEYYLQYDLLFTCGKQLDHNTGRVGSFVPPTPKLIVSRLYRAKQWRCEGLISFKYHLFEAIDPKDVHPQALETSLIYPMLELAGSRVHFFSQVQQVTNRPSSWKNLPRELQRRSKYPAL